MTDVWSRYGATAARPAGRPGPAVRPSGTTIDIHSHVLVPAAAEFIKPHAQLMVAARKGAPDTMQVDQKQTADVGPLMTSAVGRRLKTLDDMGIDIQVVAPAPPQCFHGQGLPAEIAVPAVRIVNEGISDYVRRHPDRFIGFGTVPLQDPHEAARELDRCLSELGLRGAEILTNVGDNELSAPAHDAFWEKAEALGAPILIHPSGPSGGFKHDRFARFYFGNVIGNPLETTVALQHLILDGVLERFPKLKIIAVHGGGFTGAYSGRMDHAWGARSDSHGTLPNPPSTYLKKIFVDTVVFTPLQLHALINTFGADHVVLGTDYPFDMAEFEPLEHLHASGLAAETMAAIAGKNAKALLGL